MDCKFLAKSNDRVVFTHVLREGNKLNVPIIWPMLGKLSLGGLKFWKIYLTESMSFFMLMREEQDFEGLDNRRRGGVFLKGKEVVKCEINILNVLNLI